MRPQRVVCWLRQWASAVRAVRRGWPLELRSTGHTYDSGTWNCITCGDNFWAGITPDGAEPK